jgi:hypothetical protein
MAGRGRRGAAVAAAILGGVLAVCGLAGAAGGFQVVPLGAPAGTDTPGIAFDSASDGWVVGSVPQQAGYNGFGRAPFTARWNGSGWTSFPGPDTRFYDDTLADVAAISTTDAWAVGQHKHTGFKSPVTPFVLHWNGTAWSEVATPTLSFTRYTLAAVTAISANDIWAVGKTFTGSPLIEHWNGTTWSVVNGPTVSGGSLTGIAGTASNDVWAVGAAGAQTLVEHWNGSAWSVVPSPNLPPQASGVAASDLLTSVTAVTTRDAWAVGYQIDVQSGSFQPLKTLTEHWNGSAWSIVSSPSAQQHNVLAGVKALGSGDVWAVGAGWTDQSTGVPVERPELLHWTGSAWSSATPPPNVGSSDNFLTDITATGASVWTVGSASGGPLVVRGP